MDLLVCVGGGGQHIALAISRMVRLGVWTNVPNVLVIDADLTCKLAQRLRTFADPREAQGTESNTAHAPHPIQRLRMEPPLATAKAGDRFRASYLGAHAGGGDNAGGLIEEELFELFYNTQADGVDIQKGMAAQPSVGAAVFAELGISHLGETLNGYFKQVDRVFVASSFIGGTGAGVTHQLVKFLHESPYRGNRELYGTFLLTWLEIADGGQGAANDLTMINSAQHGIQAYIRETAPRLTKGMLVGARENPTRADKDNDESVSIYPLLAAYGLTTIAADTTGAHKGRSTGDNIFTLTSPGANWRWLLEQKWDTGGKNHASATIAERWAAAIVVERIVAIFMDPQKGVEFREVDGVAFKRTNLPLLPDRHPNWGTEIRFWIEKKGGKDTALAAQVLQHLDARMRQLKMVTGYLNAVFGAGAESILSHAGDHKLQHRYELRDKLTKEQAYGYLAASIQHRANQLKSLRDDKSGADPAPLIAMMMEEALMEETLKGGVIQ
jgi:hypothetical protein